MDHGDVPSW